MEKVAAIYINENETITPRNGERITCEQQNLGEYGIVWLIVWHGKTAKFKFNARYVLGYELEYDNNEEQSEKE